MRSLLVRKLLIFTFKIKYDIFYKQFSCRLFITLFIKFVFSIYIDLIALKIENKRRKSKRQLNLYSLQNLRLLLLILDAGKGKTRQT